MACVVISGAWHVRLPQCDEVTLHRRSRHADRRGHVMQGGDSLTAAGAIWSADSPQFAASTPSPDLQHSNHEHAELEGKLVAAVLASREGDWAGLAQQMGDAQKVGGCWEAC